MIYTVTLNPAIDYVIQVADFNEGQLNVTDTEHKFPGGKGINVSRVLKQLEVPSTNVGFIGGFTGNFIREKLQEEGLMTDFIEVQGDTRINIKLRSQVETEINGRGPIIEAEDLAKLKETLYSLTSDDLVVFSGSIPKGLSTGIYLELVKEMNQRHIPFVVDISSQELLDILPFKPVLVKPNHHELAAIFETTFETIDDMLPYGEKLLNGGAQNVLISMGKDGAMLFSETGIFRVEGLTGELKNSVGAGDSMVAGFTGEYVSSADPVEALKWGVACGTATTFSDDLATAAFIKEIYEKVEVEKL